MVFDGGLVVGCCKIKARMQECALALNPPATWLLLSDAAVSRTSREVVVASNGGDFFKPIRPVAILSLAVGKNIACLAR